MALWVVLGIKILLVLFLGYLCVSLAVVVLSGAPYIPSASSDLTAMLELLGPAAGRRVVDLGSGDGRVVIALARAGFVSEGVEIIPLLVWRSRWKIVRAGLGSKAKIFQKNLWSCDFSAYDIVIVYGLPHLMDKFEAKLRSELKPGALILANKFQLPDWEPAAQKGDVSLYVQEASL